MKKEAVIAFAALVLIPIAGSAQQEPSARLDAALRSAASAGIPVSLLETRVAEGRAKGIPMERIAAAVERRGAALQRARDAMSAADRLTAADLSAGADAIEAGIGRGALHAVIQEARAEDRAVALAVLTYLHREQGLPVGDALRRVSDALARGPDALRNLPTQAAAAAGRGGKHPSMRGRPDGVGAGPPAGVPAPGARPGSGRPGNVRPGGKPGGGSGGL